jgi:hypothetical protein
MERLDLGTLPEGELRTFGSGVVTAFLRLGFAPEFA